MKTAMQELIENYYKLETIDEFIHWFSVNENKLLEKEREQIINSHNEGIWIEGKAFDDGEDYYNQNYNQKQHIINIMKADEDDDLYNQIN